MTAKFTNMFGLDVILRHDYSGTQMDKINDYRQASFNYFIKYLENYPDSKDFKTAIDIGCWDLYNVELFNKFGYTCKGIDLYSDVEGVEKIDFYKLSDTNEKYDMVFCNHTLEHADSTYKLMEQMSTITKDKWLLFIAVPDWESDRAWDLYQSTTHFSILTYGFLDTMLKRFGYQTIGIKKELRQGAKELRFIWIKK